MNDTLKLNISKGNVILFLGAGAACTSVNRNGDKLLLGDLLAKDMSEFFGVDYQNEPLKDIYASLKFTHKDRVMEYFNMKMRGCTPSESYAKLAKYAWKRIYTINIDDAFDNAIMGSRAQEVYIHSLGSRYNNHDQTYQRLDYVKLHGSVDRLHEGVIFSPEEYADISAHPHYWYSMLPEDYLNSVFLFIGTKLDESALLKILNDYKSKYKTSPGVHYLLVPSATTHQINSLKSSYNIEHISGTLEDFVLWLEKEFPAPLTPMQLFNENNPAIAKIFNNNQESDTRRKISARDMDVLTSVTPINSAFLNSIKVYDGLSSECDFYTGMKPTWSDVKSKIPAELHAFQFFCNAVINNIGKKIHINVLIGQAGSGKTTLLMQAAEYFSKHIDIPVYYFDHSSPLDEVIFSLNAIHDKYLLFVDKLSSSIHSLRGIIKDKKFDKCYLVCTERKNIWKKTCEPRCQDIYYAHDIGKITKDDASNILKKLEIYGRWAHLKTLSEEDRINAFMLRSDKQLLIALLEATSGKGFQEIIEDDYNNLASQEEKDLVNIVGLFTLQNNSGIKKGNAVSALVKMHPTCVPESVFNGLDGIVHDSHGSFYARHPIYVDHLFNNVTNKHQLADAIVAIVQSFSAYEVPYAKSLSKKDYGVFKSILNYRFLRHRISDKDITIDVFERIGKQLERDGHYWLQYGLSLKHYGLYEKAHDKLEVSESIYSQPLSRHALGTLDILLALKSDDEYKSQAYFEAGKRALEALDVDPKYRDDWYPIISLAEGEIKYTQKILGLNEAKERARHYANIISVRKKKYSGNKNLSQAWAHIVSFATSGEWPESFLEKDVWD